MIQIKKYKKNLLYLSTIIFLITYYLKDHDYNPSIKICDDTFFATYSDGLVYIGDEEFLNNIKCDENDVLICDNRKNLDDPNMIIYNSCCITDKDKRNEILEIVCEYEKCYPSSWNRSIESMRLEWFMHNVGYFFNYKRARTTDVDLNNNDEEKYDKKVLRKVLKL